MHVILNVPAVGKTMVIESPGLKLTPPVLLSWLGAPFSAENWPCMPMTRLWVPLLVKVTPCPALIVTLVGGEKLAVASVIVAAPLAAVVAVGAVVLVGAVVAVGLVPAVGLLPPHAASTKRQAMIPADAQRVTRARDASVRGDTFEFDDRMRSSLRDCNKRLQS